MAMPPDTMAVIVGSAHCGAKWEGCANTSPMNVAIALIVACREALSIVRSICARRETATAALTIPQTEARNACSKLNAAKTFPRAITRKQASHAPPNFSAAGRTNPLVRRSPNASRTLNLRLRIGSFLLGPSFTTSRLYQIPLIRTVGPLAQSDGHDAPRLVDELVPCRTTMVDEIVVGFEDAVGEPVVAHELPDV